MIRGYPRHASVLPGSALTLHVATDSTRFRVTFHRWGDGPQPAWQSSWLAGVAAPDGAADQDWNWPAYTFSIPPDWPSAVYIADFEEEGRKTSFNIAREHGAALFVVRARRRHGHGRRAGSGARRGAQGRDVQGGRTGRMLYKLPLATYHAYNCSGGACFYAQPPHSHHPPGARVSLRRPGGGIGGPVWGAADYYDAASPRQSFAHWDARFIGWLVRNGYAPEFCTDLDIHADPGLLDDVGLLVSAGHDEYWSEATRDAVEDFVGAGGNLAFFAANLCWWRIHLVDEDTAMVCHQGGPEGARDHWWPRSGAARPEDSLGGVSYRHGGGWWDGPRSSAGYRVRQPAHWVFEGTGLMHGDALGADTWPPLAGYECDGAPLQQRKGAGGCMDDDDDIMLSNRAGECSTPTGYTLLADAPLDAAWQELPPREHHGAGQGIHAATLGLFTRQGTVFSAGTTDWAQVLACGRDRRVERITRNVLDGLLRR